MKKQVKKQPQQKVEKDDGKVYAFIVGAFMGKIGEGLTDYCSVEVYVKTEEEAIERAKKLITKNYYEVSKIIEIKQDAK